MSEGFISNQNNSVQPRMSFWRSTLVFGRFCPKLKTWKHEDVSMTAGFFDNKLVESVLVFGNGKHVALWHA